MWLIVGLGNPGSKYVRTRHNVGFFVVEEIATKLGLIFTDRKLYRYCRGSVDGRDVILLEPLTFMNRSGDAVKSVVYRFGINVMETIVIHDDLDLEPGRLRIRKGGSSGGQKGVNSIIERLGTRDFPRIRIGIGRDPDIPAEKYVLSRFSKEEGELIRRSVRTAAEAAVTIVEKGIDTAMNRFNGVQIPHLLDNI